MRLVPAAQRSGGFERQRGNGEDVGIEPQFPARRGLRFEGAHVLCIRDVYVGVLGLVVAVDAELLDPYPHLLDGETVGSGILARGVDSEGANEVIVDQGMLGRDLRGGAARDLVADPASLQDHDGQAGVGEKMGGRQPHDPGADNGDVNGARCVELRV